MRRTDDEDLNDDDDDDPSRKAEIISMDGAADINTKNCSEYRRQHQHRAKNICGIIHYALGVPSTIA